MIDSSLSLTNQDPKRITINLPRIEWLPQIRPYPLLKTLHKHQYATIILLHLIIKSSLKHVLEKIASSETEKFEYNERVQP